ncbi:MAG TPA: IclR family transcriptional regulator C-terminal domain-containing protein, partial [Ideonella sp.]|nr:IclR family transcriptional regulator C-terminal domain-containing protein [Ideonella sp.]
SAVAFLGSDVGTRMSLATSALGRAWLAGIAEPAGAALLAPWRKRGKLAAGFDAALAEARRCGYALSLGEWHPNINAAAVPLRTAGGEVVCLNCGGPAFVLSAERLREVVVPRLLQAAAALAHDIGGVAGPALTAAAPTPEPLTRPQKAAP